MKYYGEIGFIWTEEDPVDSGIWVERQAVRKCYGDVVRNNYRNINTSQINDNLEFANQLSILADDFTYSNFHRIRYAEFMGVKCKVTTVDIQRPRLILTLGGEYNGEQA